MLYSEKVMVHFTNPRNVGEIEDANGVGEVGKTVDDALKLTNSAVVEALEGLPPVKIHCSVLAEQAIKTALADYYTRQGIDPTPFVGELKDPDEEHLACEM